MHFIFNFFVFAIVFASMIIFGRLAVQTNDMSYFGISGFIALVGCIAIIFVNCNNDNDDDMPFKDVPF